MSRSRAAASLVGSPVLLGAITILVVIVAVFLAYNANRGLPFVPTYNIRVETANAANLVEGNEVRLAGFRVGTVDRISTGRKKGQSIAQLDLKLQKQIEPLSVDSQLIVRSRSALGLKYVEIKPGTSGEPVQAGATLPVANTDTPVELDDVLNTFDAQARRDSQTTLAGFGDAFAGRGQSINIALAELPELFEHLTPVMDALNDPDTDFDGFFRGLGDAAAEAAPVARTQAKLFTELADTFEAFSASPPALQETISRQPPLYAAGIDKLPFQRAFLANLTDLSNRLRPAVASLEQRLPTINAAIIEGTETNRILPIYNRELENVLEALDYLAEDPNTLLALKDLTVTANILEPLLEVVAPYNTVCNDANYFFTSLSDHASDRGNDGTSQRINTRAFNTNVQDDRFNDSKNDRPADISLDDSDGPGGPDNTDPHLAEDEEGNDFMNLTAQANNPAIDAAGNADCQVGQWGKLHGPLATGIPFGEEEFDEEDPNIPGTAGEPSGGTRVVADGNTPGLAGPTYTGVPKLQDVDEDLRRVP